MTSINQVGGPWPSWAKVLPQWLKERGYRSYHSGKWHVRNRPRPVAATNGQIYGRSGVRADLVQGRTDGVGEVAGCLDEEVDRERELRAIGVIGFEFQLGSERIAIEGDRGIFVAGSVAKVVDVFEHSAELYSRRP